MKLSKEELQNIYGGGAGLILIGIGALCVFIAGIIDGFVRPLKCNE